jgi:hypothetical protein
LLALALLFAAVGGPGNQPKGPKPSGDNLYQNIPVPNLYQFHTRPVSYQTYFIPNLICTSFIPKQPGRIIHKRAVTDVLETYLYRDYLKIIFF